MARTYSVEIPDTSITRTPPRRPRGESAYAAEPWQAESTIVVRWVLRTRTDAPVSDMDDALTIEARVLRGAAVTPIGLATVHEPLPQSIRRQFTEDGQFMVCTLTMFVKHVLAVDALPD